MSVIIFRYLTREILTTLLAATLVLLVIFVTNQSLQFLQRAAMGLLPATELLRLISLQIPLLLGYLLPLGLYLGILLTLGRLYLDSEMTVLSACGVSRAKLTEMVFVIALFVAVIVAWLMAVVVPAAQGDSNDIVNRAAVTASVEQVIPGRFMVFGKKNDDPIVFYASSVSNHSVLHGVFLARQMKDVEHPAREKWGVIVAKSAFEKQLPGQEGQYVVFTDGYRYTGVPGEKNYSVMQFDQYGSRLMVSDIPTLNVVQYYSISKLWASRAKDPKSAAELQWRIAMPISALVFALLAVPLSEVRPRYGKFTQLFPAILIYATYADLIFLTRAWISGGQLSPVWGMWYVHGGALCLAIILMLYQMGWHRIRRLGTRTQ
ncbi:MAG: LPS export ABC transporter permease LptF [Gammaproteobacteria bacterium RIFCSPHIGHO2_12_FULL_40_19]|nr:MAG: LPS export ABC transporter permease LptF [Gammaproteobacteria bacterium RIFCSPHIGHO2_12_FULL_40_19]